MSTLHLVDRFPYHTTLCGLPLNEVGEDWTDALAEVVESPASNDCPRCLGLARKIVSRVDREADAGWRREMAVEAGMLHGVAAYNDMMGF